MSLNVCALLGRLTADPIVNTTQSGKSVCSFCVAVDRDFVPQGEQRKADFINVVVWGKTAEFVGRYFTKGSSITVSGRMESRQYTDKNGNNRTSYELNATNVGFAGGKTDAKKEPDVEPVQDADDYKVIEDTEDLPF